MSENQHLTKIVEQYRKNTPKSGKLFDGSTGFLPGGIGGSAPTYEPYPLFVKKGEGSKLWDVDGNEYVDFNLCWGVLFVGHSHPKLVKGLQDQLLARRFPVIDTVRFVNSGSEATAYAIRLARRYARKDKIVKIEGAYHGISDSLHISKRPSVDKAGPANQPISIPYGRGITKNTVKDTLIAPFNDIDAIRNLVDGHPNEIAAVIIEPAMMNAGVIPPQKGYLRALREFTEESGIVLIFDEVKTGVKIAPGGATEYFGVTPDLISLAKAIGGGLPIGACGGKEEIMAEIDKEGLFGTFSANPLSIRAI
jgi:glutamate-1-semialdehyde 2,1-aminomutase